MFTIPEENICYGRCWLLEDDAHLPRKILAIAYTWLISA